jgi:hypothetical protein
VKPKANRFIKKREENRLYEALATPKRVLIPAPKKVFGEI